MNILLIHNILWSNYKASVFSELGRLCALRGHDLFVAQIAETESARTTLSAADSSIHRYHHKVLFPGSYEAVPRLRMFWQLLGLCFSRPSDVTVLPGYYLPEHWLMLLVARLQGRIVLTVSDQVLAGSSGSRLRKVLKRFFLTRCDGVFTYGARSTEFLLMHGVAKDRILVRLQAAYLPSDYDETVVRQNRLTHFAERTVQTILFAGRLSEEKNLDRLLEAFAILRTRMTTPPSELRLRIIGGGPMRVRLTKLVSDLGLTAHVDMVPGMPYDQLRDEYQRADCLVLPSLREPWGVVVNESLANGCPVAVSAACGCVPELVVPGVTGHTFNPEDVTGIASAIELTLVLSSDRGRSTNACLDVIRPSTAQRSAAQMLEGIEKISKTHNKLSC